MKKYKLKEEAFKHLTLSKAETLRPLIRSRAEWEVDLGYLFEALEEVPQRIELRMVARDEHVDKRLIRHFLEKKDFTGWTEQERKDIETFLNEFGSMENLSKTVVKFLNYVDCRVEENESIMGFSMWLRKNKTE